MAPRRITLAIPARAVALGGDVLVRGLPAPLEQRPPTRSTRATRTRSSSPLHHYSNEPPVAVVCTLLASTPYSGQGVDLEAPLVLHPARKPPSNAGSGREPLFARGGSIQKLHSCSTRPAIPRFMRVPGATPPAARGVSKMLILEHGALVEARDARTRVIVWNRRRAPVPSRRCLGQTRHRE
jgi:hypothetical protein